MTLRMLAATAALGVALVVTGCVPSEPVVTPAETGATAPIFATDEEALAAAVAAYDTYMRVSDQIGSDGGHGYERMEKLVTEDWYETEVEGFKGLIDSNRFLRGSAKFSNPKLQQVLEDPERGASVIVYMCLDLTESRTLDGSGNDVTPEGRAEHIPIEVSFASSADDPIELLIAGVLPWQGHGVC